MKWTHTGSASLSGTYHGKAELQDELLDPLFGILKHGVSTTVCPIAGNDFEVTLTSGSAETNDG
jgi:hypothetical protein